MNDSEVSGFLEISERLVRQAGQICLDMQKNLGDIGYKSPKDLVTKADLASDQYIVESLQKAFPFHRIRTEESGFLGPSDSEWQWILDPIDGTVNFSRGMPLWGISLALLYESKPVLAVCFLPRLQEMFTAVRGRGAFCNGQPIRVSSTNNLAQALVSNGDFNVGPVQGIPALNAWNIRLFTQQATHLQRVKSVGSAVVEGCFVACGRLDLYSMTISYPWDIAGVVLMVEEAGGKVTHIRGNPLRLQDEEPVLFSNGILHEPYLAVCPG